MAGISYDKVAVGDTVLVAVDSTNQPTGLWMGKVSEVTEKQSFGHHGREDSTYYEVQVILTDEKLRGTSNYQAAPFQNYTVYLANNSTRHFLKLLQDEKADKREMSLILNAKIRALQEAFAAVLKLTDHDAKAIVERVTNLLK